MVWISYILEHLERIGSLGSYFDEDLHQVEISGYICLLFEVTVLLDHRLSNSRHVFAINFCIDENFYFWTFILIFIIEKTK